MIFFSFQMIENFLIARRKADLLVFKAEAVLKTKPRRLIVSALVDFMLDTFESVTRRERQLTANAAIVLFPLLKCHEGDATVNY